MADSPFSPVRMRIASPMGMTKTLPSPMEPVRAAAAFQRPELWGALVKNAMTEDFSWDTSAREYATLYKKVLRPQAARPSRRSR